MAEEQAVGEQDSPDQEEDSKLGRLKSRVKDLVGKDDEDAESSEGEDNASAESDSGDAESESSGEESASEEAESESGEDESETSVTTDEVDLTTIAEDEDTARAQIDKMEEEGPPEDLGEWPRGKAMYLSFGGAEGEQGYEEGPAQQMGPSSLRHHTDGSVEVKGEKVDNPEDYKGEKSVGEEAEEIGMDKGAKSEGDEGEESSGDEQGQAESADEDDGQADSSSDDDPQAGSGSEGEASAGDDGSSDQESETAETS
jgi:hypothetical protein